LGESVPHRELQAIIPTWGSGNLKYKPQVTPALLGSLSTVAVNCCVPRNGKDAELGETDTLMPITVMVAEAVFVGSVTDCAVRVTVKLPAGNGAE
jgi:hypothetical protein